MITTRTEQSIIRLLPHVKNQTKEPLQKESNPFFCKIQDLIGIVAKYRKARDEHSRALFHWAVTFSKFADRKGWCPRKKDVLKRIEKLKNLMRDPIHDEIWREPWYARGILWEKQLVDRYQHLHQQEYGTALQAVPHLFMQEILQWMGEERAPLQQEVNFSLEQFERLVDLHFLEKQQIIDNERLTLSKKVLSKGLKKKHRKEKFEKQICKVKKFYQKRAKNLQQGISEIKKEQQETKELIKKNRGMVERFHKNTHKKQEKMLHRAHDTLAKTNKTLEDQTDQINNLSLQSATMRTQLSQLQRQKDEGFLTRLIKKIF